MDKPLFILGAGFSKWINSSMPLLKDLYNSLQESLKNEIKGCGLTSLLNENSLEMLMSYLITRYPWKSEKDHHKHLSIYFAIEEQIVKTIIESQKKALENIQNKDEINKLISYWNENNSNIITFNYDTLIEILIDYEHKRNWFTFWELPIPTIEDRISSGVAFRNSNNIKLPIVITKLHGSINWYRSKNFPAKNDMIYYKYTYRDDNQLEKNNLQGLKSFIIPPTISKESFLDHEIISIIWERASKQINESKNIVIMGYSFPESDAYVNLLFASSLKSDTNIFIINTENDNTFKRKIEKYFKNYIKEDKLNLDYCGIENSISSYINEQLSYRLSL